MSIQEGFKRKRERPATIEKVKIALIYSLNQLSELLRDLNIRPIKVKDQATIACGAAANLIQQINPTQGLPNYPDLVPYIVEIESFAQVLKNNTVKVYPKSADKIAFISSVLEKCLGIISEFEKRLRDEEILTQEIVLVPIEVKEETLVALQKLLRDTTSGMYRITPTINHLHLLSKDVAGGDFTTEAELLKTTNLSSRKQILAVTKHINSHGLTVQSAKEIQGIAINYVNVFVAVLEELERITNNINVTEQLSKDLKTLLEQLQVFKRKEFLDFTQLAGLVSYLAEHNLFKSGYGSI